MAQTLLGSTEVVGVAAFGLDICDLGFTSTEAEGHFDPSAGQNEGDLSSV